MEYSEFYERIYGVKDLKEISNHICENYDIGIYVGYKHIKIGYEDFNFILETTKGKYFIKILNKDRDNSQCERFLKILDKTNQESIKVPKIYMSNKQSIIYNLNIDNKILRICVMEYIDGTNMYLLNRYLTLQELENVAEQVAKINRINFQVEEYYDEWTITNFELEYNKKGIYLNGKDKTNVEQVEKDLLKIDLDNLPKCYIHADIIQSNLILDRNNDVWVIDFSVLNYLPRVIELAVAVFGICLTDDRKESIIRMNTFLNTYNKYNILSIEEIKVFPIIFNSIAGMNILQTIYIKKTKETFEENEHWLREGRKVFNMNIGVNDINIEK